MRKDTDSELLLELRRIMSDVGAEKIIRYAHSFFGDDLVMASSFGAESELMIHLVTRIIPNIRLIFIDTGYLFPETHAHRRRLTARYSIIRRDFAPRKTPRDIEREYGRLWEQGEEGRKLYGQITKVEPMERALKELGALAMLDGIKNYQTEHRSKLAPVELDRNGIYNIHPVLKWTEDEVGAYFTAHKLHWHPLVKKGYGSIGDTHSTLPGKGREGRLLGKKKECGLHTRNRTA